MTAFSALRRSFDVLHLNEEISSMFLANMTSAKKVITVHNPPPALGSGISGDEVALRGANFSIQRSLVYDQCDTIIALNDYSARFLSNLGVKNVSVVPLPVDIELFHPSWDGRNHNQVLFVGRLEKRKRVDKLIEAISKIDASLLVVGDGVERKNLEALAAKTRVANKVTFAGKVPLDRLVGMYRKAGVFALPSLLEVSPRVVHEAGASGLPVVLPDVPLYEAYKFAAKFDPNENGALAATIYDIIIDRNRAARMSMEARRWAEENLSADIVAEKLHKIYVS